MVVLSSPADNLEVQGEGYSQGNTLYADATISNPGDKRATASMTVRMKFNGEVKESFTPTEEISVESGESIQKSFEFGTYSELTSEEEEALQNGNFIIEFVINGEVKNTYTES